MEKYLRKHLEEVTLKSSIMQPVKLLIVLMTLSFSGKANDIKSVIKDVTLFRKGATIKRSASVSLNPGENTLYFKDLSPLLAEESIKLQSKSDLKIIEVRYENYEELPIPDTKRILVLEQNLKSLNQSISSKETSLEILFEEQELIRTLKKSAENSQQPEPELVLKSLQLYKNQLLETALKTNLLSAELDELYEEQKKINSEIEALSLNRKQLIQHLKVIVTSPRAQRADFELSYFVTGAYWTPLYDFRVTDIGENISIDYKAKIVQQSGENWENVKLKLSTSDPSLGHRAPKMNKWTIDLYGSHENNIVYKPDLSFTPINTGVLRGIVRETNGNPLPFVNIKVNNSEIGTVSDLDGKFSLILPTEARSITVSQIGYLSEEKVITGDYMDIVLAESEILLDEIEIVTYRAPLIAKSALSRHDINEKTFKHHKINALEVATVMPEKYDLEVAFDLADPVSLQNDAKGKTVLIKVMTIPTNYQYFCAPKLEKDAFLFAHLTDWKNYHLLEGDISIYLNGTYTGKSYLSLSKLKDTLTVSIGRDTEIAIERKVINEFAKKNFSKSSLTQYRSFEINIVNHKNAPIQLTVVDQIPISTQKEIEVEFSKDESTNLNNNGQLKWELKSLPKGGKAQLSFSYEIRHPADIGIYLE